MSKNFYTASLMGGLGNQMFQVAHAYCQGLKYDVKSLFSPSSSTPNQGYQPSKYLSNIFRKVDFSGVKGPTVRAFEKNWNNPNPDFDPKKSIDFYGYYQGTNNFLGYDEEVRTLFCPTSEFVEKIKSIFPDVLNENSVSVHVRRGDYSRFPDVHSMIDVSYINFCIEQIKNKNKVYIFSDDKEWVKKIFVESNYVIVDGLEDFEELWMISLCHHNIMSCSSFSWWGSFLNTRENRLTYVPSLWFGPNGPKEFNNIYEKNWNIINVKNINGILYYEQN